MIQTKTKTKQTTQLLLANISGLYQSEEITIAEKNELVGSIKEAIQTNDYSDFLKLLAKSTRFCAYPELVEDCRRIVEENNKTY